MRPGRSPRTARGSKPRLRPGFSALIERLPSRGQTVRFPRLSRYSRGLLRSPRPSSGLRSLARDPLAAAGSLTPSSERLKAPAAPGLFRGDGEITVKGSKCQGWGISSAIKGVGVRKQAQISPPPFFLRLSPVGGSGWEPYTAKVSEVEPDPRKQGDRCAKAGTNFPTAFFFCGCRLTAAAAGSHPPQRQQNPPCRRWFSCSGSSSDGKTHRCRRCSAVRAPAGAATNPPSTTAKSTAAAGVQLVGLQQRGQQNGRR